MIYQVMISDTLNSILLVIFGGMIGILSQPISHIFISKFNKKTEIKNSQIESYKKIYSKVNFICSDIIEQSYFLRFNLTSFLLINDDPYTAREIEDKLEELQSSLKELRDFSISIDINKDERLKILVKNIHLNVIALESHYSNCYNYGQKFDRDLIDSEIELFKNSIAVFKSYVFDKF
ncbi:MAG: hypothetical protein AB7E61_06315 [Acholeplasmataceae bacterium]